MESPSNSLTATSNPSTNGNYPMPCTVITTSSTTGNIVLLATTKNGEHHLIHTTVSANDNSFSNINNNDNINLNCQSQIGTSTGTTTASTIPAAGLTTIGLFGGSPILQCALRGERQMIPLSSPPSVIPAFDLDEDMTEDMIPKSTEKLRDAVFEKYFKRNPQVSKSFRTEDPEAALRKAFFDFVLHVPIIIDGYKVPRKSWAKAFYEMDVIQSAKCLFEALFSQDEMSNCTLNGKAGTKELSAVKMLAILRASCWMKNKEQDPYSFNSECLSHNVHPSKDEQDKIEKKVFTERRSQAHRKIKKGKRKSPYEMAMDTNSRSTFDGDSDSQHSEASHLDNQDNESVKSEGSLPENNNNSNGKYGPATDVSIEDEEFGVLEKLYYRFPDDFLERLIPNRSDICIDGILIPRVTWQKAFEEAQKDTVKAAWTLFQFLFSDDEIKNCTLNGKNGTTELCPVRKLAIIRAVQWMSKNANNLKKIHYFDNDDDTCNLFPSEEDKERIETKVFTEKRYQQSRQLNTKNKIPS